MWIGGLYLLQNLGFLLPPGKTIGWSIIWPVALIILGVAVKHCKYSRMCGGMFCKGGNCGMCAGGKCGMEGNGGEHKCEGPNCKH